MCMLHYVRGEKQVIKQHITCNDTLVNIYIRIMLKAWKATEDASSGYLSKESDGLIFSFFYA